MPTSGAPPLADSEARDDQRIKRVVDAYLRTRQPIPGFDRDDLYQEGRLVWFEKQHTYQQSRGASRGTYIGRVVTNHLRSLARLGRAKKRGQGVRPLSLDAAVTDDGDLLADLLPHSDPQPDELAERIDLIERAARVRRRLKERERYILEARAEGRPSTKIASDLGIHRSTLYDDIERIQRVARDEGLEGLLR